MKSGKSFLERLVDRMDRMDPSNLQTYVHRLVREKGFLETVFNTIHEGVIVLDHALRVRFINTSATRLLGIQSDPQGERIDRHLRELDWAALMEAPPEQWRRASRQEIEVFYPEHRFLSFYIVPVGDDEDDRPRSAPLAALILQDVTETREHTEEHVESQRVQAITMLAAGVAHELGNPLNSLGIHLQLLSRCLGSVSDPEVSEEASELLEVAAQEVKRLDGIVQNFLHAVRPVPLALEPLDLCKTLASTLQFLRREIEERGIRVEAAMPDSLPTIMGDDDQLRQAFFNILRNSVQAMGQDGLIRIECGVRDDFVDVRFMDDGSGMSTEDLTRIMEPYYTTKAQGTGLGMLIVERVVRGHGGELGIESSPGAGTTVTISLPRQDRRVRMLHAGAEVIEIGDDVPVSPPEDADS
jgi:two-component system, sporulation sensor kinase E